MIEEWCSMRSRYFILAPDGSHLPATREGWAEWAERTEVDPVTLTEIVPRPGSLPPLMAWLPAHTPRRASQKLATRSKARSLRSIERVTRRLRATRRFFPGTLPIAARPANNETRSVRPNPGLNHLSGPAHRCRFCPTVRVKIDVASDDHAASAMVSGSGLSRTVPTGVQLRVERDQRWGRRRRARSYTPWRCSKTTRSSPKWRWSGVA
jgi:hypothetical protein